VKRLIPLVLLALVLSGCKLRAEAAITVAEDESGSLGLEVSLDEELRDVLTQQGQDLDLSGQLDGLPAGWTAQPFVDGEFEGMRATTDFDSFGDLEATLAALESSDFGGQGNIGDLLADLTLTHERDTFEFSAALDDVSGSFSGAVGNGFGDLDIETLFDSVFQVRVLVALPGIVTSHNGDAIDGSTITWDIDLESSGRTLSATSEIEGGGLDLALVGSIVGGLILLAIGFVFVQRRNEQRARELVATAVESAVVEEPNT